MSVWSILLIYLAIGALFVIGLRVFSEERYRENVGEEPRVWFSIGFLIVIWPYVVYDIFLKEHLPAIRLPSFTSSQGPNALDFRSDEERKIERKAQRGDSLGKQADALVQELITIGLRESFLSVSPGGSFDSKCRNIRAREIGETLNRMGGINMMKAAGYRVAYRCQKPGASRELEYCWNGIGEWLA
jgi:hypothetical protein